MIQFRNTVIFIHNLFSLLLSIAFMLLFINSFFKCLFYINDVNAFIVFSNKMFYLSQKLLKMNSGKEFETSSK